MRTKIKDNLVFINKIAIGSSGNKGVDSRLLTMLK